MNLMNADQIYLFDETEVKQAYRLIAIVENTFYGYNLVYAVGKKSAPVPTRKQNGLSLI